MIIKQKLVTVLILAVTALFIMPSSSVALNDKKKSSTKKSKVIIFSLPRVTWDNLDNAKTPNIDKLIIQGSVAAMSVRTLGPITTPAEGYATISAGSRAAVSQTNDSNFISGDEKFDGNFGLSIYTDENSNVPKGKFAGYGLGYDISKQLNKKGLYNSRIGSFTDALESKGKSIAVYGNADSCYSDDPECFHRAIAYVGSNSKGLLKNGDISRELLNIKDQATSRLTTNYDVMAKKVAEGVAKNDVVVSECSDLERIESDRATTASSKSDKDFLAAINKCDQYIGSVMKTVDLSRDQVFILSASSPISTEQTTIFIAAGKSIKVGYTASSTTRREGIVTLVDVAPSILSFLDVSIPKNMGQTFFDYKSSSDSLNARKSKLIKLNTDAIIRDKAISPATVFLILIVIFSALVAMVAYTRAKSWRNTARFTAFMALPLPTLAFLLKPFTQTLQTPSKFIGVFFIVAIVFAYICMTILKKFGYLKIILTMSIINIAVQFVDIIFLGPMQLNTVFGYSPVIAGRFAGFGNMAFAIISMSCVILVAMIKELTVKKTEWSSKKINLGIIIFLIVVLIFDGAPYWGSDVGGVLALTPTIFVIGLMLFEKRISIKALIVSAFVTLAAISTFAFIDLARPAEQRTHLGRFASSLVKGEAGTIIERKINSNVSILTDSTWAVIVIIALLYFSFLFLHPEKFLQRTHRQHPGFKYLAYPGLVLAVLGMVLNDSGIAIPGMMLAVVLPVVVLLSLGVSDNEKELKV